MNIYKQVLDEFIKEHGYSIGIIVDRWYVYALDNERPVKRTDFITEYEAYKYCLDEIALDEFIDGVHSTFEDEDEQP